MELVSAPRLGHLHPPSLLRSTQAGFLHSGTVAMIFRESDTESIHEGMSNLD